MTQHTLQGEGLSVSGRRPERPRADSPSTQRTGERPIEATIIDANGGTNGQTIARIDGPDGPLILKCYGKKRSWVRQLFVQLGHWTFAGKSGCGPRARSENERACIDLWTAHGFDVFRTAVAPVAVGPRRPEATPTRAVDAVAHGRPTLLLDAVPGVRLYDLLLHATDEADERAVRTHLARFAGEWSRRHALALAEREPRLLHEHGTFRHVWVADDRLITFDFEISWRRRRSIESLIGREIGAFLRSLGRASKTEDRFGARLQVVLEAYGDRAFLARVVDRQLAAGQRWATWCFARRGRRADPFRRTRIMQAVRAFLERSDETAGTARVDRN